MIPRVLSPGQVKALRRDAADGKSIRQLFLKYQLSKRAITRIIKRQTYKDVE